MEFGLPLPPHSPASLSHPRILRAGIAHQSADYRLCQLHDEGQVASKKIEVSLMWIIAGGLDGRH